MHPLRIVGVGENAIDGLTAEAASAIASADCLIGSERLLGLLSQIAAGKEQLVWPKPFDALLDAIREKLGDDRQVAVLVTGDPSWFSAGNRILEAFEQASVFPAPSAFTLAAAKMGWRLQDCETLSLHGRAISLAVPYFQPGRRLLCLAEADTAKQLASLLVEHNLGDSRLHCLSHLGGPAESRHDAPAKNWNAFETPSLTVIALEIVGTSAHGRGTVLNDTAYDHDGQLTKKTVRAATIQKLQPMPAQVLWDLGAGSGAISIEWLRAEPRAIAFAVEKDQVRAKRIANNAEKLGTPQLTVASGEYPASLRDLPNPDAIFVGGGLTATSLSDLFEKLPTGGRLVANAVTMESERLLFDFVKSRGLRPEQCLERIACASPRSIGNSEHHLWDEQLPVTILAVTK